MSQGTQVKVTLNDLGDVVLLDKGMSATSLVNMLRQRRNQQHESWRPNSDSSSGTCMLWQYGLWSFQTGDTQLERFLPKNQHTIRAPSWAALD